MGFNDHIDYQLCELLNDLLSEGWIEEGTPAYGIAKKVVGDGGSLDDLSQKQSYIYENVIVPALQQMGDDREVQRLLEKDRD